MQTAFTLPAPCKINLGLRILGRRDDGYHLLQTSFQMLSFCDYLHFYAEPKFSSQNFDISFKANSANQISIALEDNLVYRAAQALAEFTGNELRGHIEIEKHLPSGAGLGGGSSDAATALIGLNYLWKTQVSKKDLQKIALPLGADVPVFVNAKSAWAEGVGEVLTNLNLPKRYFLVVKPEVSIETGEIFSHPRLTRDSSSITIARFLGVGSIDKNDCEAIACQLYPEVSEVIQWLNGYNIAKMTGTGSCVFCAFDSKQEAEAVHKEVPSKWFAFVAEGLNDSPLATAMKSLPGFVAS